MSDWLGAHGRQQVVGDHGRVWGSVSGCRHGTGPSLRSLSEMPWQTRPHAERRQSRTLRSGAEWQLRTATSVLLAPRRGLSEDILQKGTEMCVYALAKWQSAEGVKTLQVTMRARSWINVGLSTDMEARKRGMRCLSNPEPIRAYCTVCWPHCYISKKNTQPWNFIKDVIVQHYRMENLFFVWFCMVNIFRQINTVGKTISWVVQIEALTAEVKILIETLHAMLKIRCTGILLCSL